jgi:hypothetical protein
MGDKCKLAAQLVGLALATIALIGVFVRTGRILERLERIERDYYQGIMEGTVSRTEFQELRDIHVRAGDIE